MAEKTIFVSSGFGRNTRQPFVAIESVDLDKPIQISPTEARALAMNLLRAAEGADTDAFLVKFMGETLNEGEIAQLLYQFRCARVEADK